LWRLAYRFAGKQKTLALGVYPAVSLEEAQRRSEEGFGSLHRSIGAAEGRQTSGKRQQLSRSC
jgi:hypothetical protein